MGNPIPCASDDGNAATLLVTNLETGDTNGVCVECIPSWLASLAEVFGLVVSVPDEPADDTEPADTAEMPETEPLAAEDQAEMADWTEVHQAAQEDAVAAEAN